MEKYFIVDDERYQCLHIYKIETLSNSPKRNDRAIFKHEDVSYNKEYVMGELEFSSEKEVRILAAKMESDFKLSTSDKGICAQCVSTLYTESKSN